MCKHTVVTCSNVTYANSAYRFAVWEADSACFNGAISSAMSYYRRANDSVAAMRVFLVAQEHPYASTHWRHIVQTPRYWNTNLEHWRIDWSY